MVPLIALWANPQTRHCLLLRSVHLHSKSNAASFFLVERAEIVGMKFIVTVLVNFELIKIEKLLV